jgi:hypothetical protein
MTTDQVHELAVLLRWPYERRAVTDWAAVEKALGVALPPDFRELIEVFPPGEIQMGFSVLHPARFETAGEYRHELVGYADQLRGDAAKRAFPHPVYPDQGGVLPWATVGFDWIICWLTADDDPANWPVMVCDSRLEEWHVHDGSTATFLTALVTIPPTIAELSYVTESCQPPKFWPYSPPALAPVEPDPQYWIGSPEIQRLTEPVDAVAQLRGVVAGAATRPDDAVDWPALEERLGVRLPADYKRMVDQLGPIAVGPAHIAPPAADLLALVEDLRRRVEAERAAGAGPRGTIYPEPNGLLAWGTLEGGGLLCWVASPVDPDEWPVAVTDRSMGLSVVHSMSASRFLWQLATGGERLLLPPM